VALNHPPAASTDDPATDHIDHIVRRRLPGPDVVRAVALIGVVVMNFHGYLLLAADDSTDAGRVGEGWAAALFDPWDGPLSTRFAATFVVVAGVGVTLLTRSSVGEPGRVRQMRWRLVRRGVLLYTVGLVLDQIWPGTIIPYYGAMFVGAAALFTLRTAWVVTIGLGAAAAGAAVNAWIVWRADDGHLTSWLTSPSPDSARRYAFDVFVNGTHPLLPWFAFLCAGIVLGRLLTREWWRPAAIATGVALYSVATMAEPFASTTLQASMLSTASHDGSLVYVASALGTALIAYATIDWLAERFPGPTDPLRRAGQLTLSLYILHVLLFNLVVDWLGWIEPAGLDVALVFALGFWMAAIAAAAAWQRRCGIGPAERVYRAFGG
jgi:uncharacterized membrane protein YeiB